MIDALTINSIPIPPGYVLGTITVLHGRKSFSDSPQASSATVEVWYPAGPMPGWRSGDLIQLTGPLGAMFTGRVTDQSLRHVTDPGGLAWGVFTITAAGTLARLGIRQVGEAPWPQEAGTARADRILAAAGVPYSIQATELDTAEVMAMDVDRQTALALLDDLVKSTAAVLLDLPDGSVVYQTLAARAGQVAPYRWSDFPADDTWDGFAPALTWAGDPPSIEQWPSPGSTFPITIPPTAVLYEPEWVASEGVVVNRARVGWGPANPQQAFVEASDAASIAAHGERYTYIATQLAAGPDAFDYAARIVTTQAQDRWDLSEVVVPMDSLPYDTYTQLIQATAGRAVTIQGLPTPAPATDWLGILEGWTFTQVADGGVVSETMTLALSDPLYSLVVMTWDDYPALFTWADHEGFMTWNDLNTAPLPAAA